MGRPILLFAVSTLLAACAQERVSLLDRELSVYRYEQEKYRRADLEERYREELSCSEDLTEKILGAREEIREKEEELERLRRCLEEVEAALAEAKEAAAAAKGKAAPPREPAEGPPKPTPDAGAKKP